MRFLLWNRRCVNSHHPVFLVPPWDISATHSMPMWNKIDPIALRPPVVLACGDGFKVWGVEEFKAGLQGGDRFAALSDVGFVDGTEATR